MPASPVWPIVRLWSRPSESSRISREDGASSLSFVFLVGCIIDLMATLSAVVSVITLFYIGGHHLSAGPFPGL